MKMREGGGFVIDCEAKDRSPARCLDTNVPCKQLTILGHELTDDFLANSTSLHNQALPVFLMMLSKTKSTTINEKTLSGGIDVQAKTKAHVA